MAKIPSLRAMVLCSKIVEAPDGRPCLLGIITSIEPPAFPWRPSEFGVYVCVGEVGESAKIQLKLSRGVANTPFGEEVGTSHILEAMPGGQFDEVNLTFRLRDVVFSIPGNYTVVAYANGMYLGERRLPVVQSKP